MLNPKCRFDSPTISIIVHYVCRIFAVPVYVTAFLVLSFKCPPHFQQHRNYLAVHIFSCFLLELHFSLIWRLHVPLPWAAMCSNGPYAEFSATYFQIFCFLLMFTGASIVAMFLHRMRAVNGFLPKSWFQNFVEFMKYAFWISLVTISFLTGLIYPDLKYQEDYKLKENWVEPLPEYMWCDNCFFMRFDSTTFVLFYINAYVALSFGLIAAVLAVIETVRVLSSTSSQQSKKTAAIQKNFLKSLVYLAIVHVSCIFVPLLLYFLVNMIKLGSILDWLPIVAVLMIQEHGSISTLALFLTNKLLRRSLKEIFTMTLGVQNQSQAGDVVLASARSRHPGDHPSV